MKIVNTYSEFVDINGVEQFLLHYKSENAEAPLLLFLHGGPGMSEAVFSHSFQSGWEKFYTVVHWDQRGAGKTLTRNKKTYPSMDELMADLYSVVQYLKSKYLKDKIVILGHSFGSILGSLYVLKHPEDALYYIGAGQVISLTENEREGYEKLRELILKANNKKDFYKLEKIGCYPQKVYDKAMIKKMQDIRILQGKYKIGMNFIPIIKALFKSPFFQFSDISSLVNGLGKNKLLNEFLFSHSLEDETSNYDVPIYYVLGDRDFQAPYTIAQRYYESIQSPQKGLFMIENAGHFMMLEQPKLFTNVLTRIENSRDLIIDG